MQGRIRVSDGPSLVAFACAGAGFTEIDRLLAANELASGALIELLQGWRLPAGARRSTPSTRRGSGWR